MKRAILGLLLAVGCGEMDEPLSMGGSWVYDWQVRDNGEPFPGWDGHFRGQLDIAHDGEIVSGSLGYPDEDPAVLFGDARLRDLWRWNVYGVMDGATLALFAPAPTTAWDDDWRFALTVTGNSMEGPSYAGTDPAPRWVFRANRPH